MSSSYLRKLLVQGALAALTRSKTPDKQLVWARQLRQDKCIQLAAVALANKTARIIWSVLAKDKDYKVIV